MWGEKRKGAKSVCDQGSNVSPYRAKVSLGNASSKAPMGRSAIAQGDALGSIGVMVRRPEGAEPNGEEFHTEVFGDEAAL